MTAVTVEKYIDIEKVLPFHHHAFLVWSLREIAQ